MPEYVKTVLAPFALDPCAIRSKFFRRVKGFRALESGIDARKPADAPFVLFVECGRVAA